MIKTLFESLDKNIFTPELIETIEKEFNDAVELTAIQKIDEKTSFLNRKSEEYVDYVNEQAEKYTEIQHEELLETLDNYLHRITSDFIVEASDALDESIKTEKADMLIDAFDSMLIAGGVDVARIVESKNESSSENKLRSYEDRYNELVNENISLSDENSKLIKMGIINELSEDLSLVEAEKFKRLAESVDFVKDKTFTNRLEILKESIKGTKYVSELDKGKLNEGLKINRSGLQYEHLI